MKQYLLIFACSTLSLSLYYFGNTKTPINLDGTAESNAQENESEISFEKVEQVALGKLPSERRDTIQGLLDATRKGSPAQKIAYLDSLANLWLGYGNPDMNAYYTLEKANISGNKKHLLEGLAKAQTAAQFSPDSTAKAYFTNKSIAMYSDLEKQFPDSLQYKVQKASLLIEQKQQVMQGVMILRDVIQKDSLNLQANFMLGKLSVVSGQYDKAVGRLQTVLKQQNNDTEALYFLGEAYVGLGKKQEAIATFEKCKEMVDSPVFKKEIDKYINTIINQ